MGDKGAREVAHALLRGRPLKRGSAHTDGKVYYLFGNPIARLGPDDVPTQVKNRLLDQPGELHLSWAGWPTPSTERHINAVCSVFGRIARAKCQGRKNPVPKWTRSGNEVVADPHRWYSIKEL